MMQWLGEGGMLMLVPIVLASVVGGALFVARWRSHRSNRVIPDDTKRAVLEAVDDQRFEDASRRCDEDSSSLARVYAEGLRFRGADRAGVQAAMEDVGRRQMNRLERYVGAIGALASVTPLMGLLGTVLGMIAVFHELVDEAGSQGVVDPTALAGGIWVALVTTAAGLAVAIPLYLGYRYLLGRLDALAVELEEASTQLLDRLAPPPSEQTDGDRLQELTPSTSTDDDAASVDDSESTPSTESKTRPAAGTG